MSRLVSSPEKLCLSRVLAVLAFSVCAGCAWQTAEKVRVNDYDTKGIRYWLSKPYLFVNERVLIAELQHVYLQEGDQLIPVAHCDSRCEQIPGNESEINVKKSEDGNKNGDRGGHDVALIEESQMGDDNDKGDIAGKPVTPPPSTNTKPSKPSTGSSSGSPSNSGAKVTIAWLPDYCEQYAYRSRSFLAKSKVTISLADGWKLESAEADTDSTAVVSKLIDFFGTRVQAKEETERTQITTMAEEAQVGGDQYWIATESTYLMPGVYPIISRDDCDSKAAFDFSSFTFTTSKVWKKAQN